jgi:uncharacterized membrane protein YraQ (UPF0718 family)
MVPCSLLSSPRRSLDPPPSRAYVCEGGEVPLTAALVTLGVGIGPAFTFMQASVGTCLPTLMMLPKLIGVKLTVVYLAFWLAYSVASGILVGWIL